MSDLTDKLKAKLAFDGADHVIYPRDDYGNITGIKNYLSEERLAPLHAKLIACVEALHRVHTGLVQDIATTPKSYCAEQIARALAGLEEELK